ncbi:carboxyl transferase domain-containing protein [Actinocorallia longicatena]|uniref:Carboxyl transferase domain-containing protein n=1 Tax=Actinocorallia longicatena TaxID=111803 RepID=A0ABP6QB13_9ACTN
MTDARRLVEVTLDPGGTRSWDTPVTAPAGYAAQWREACERSGCDEAVITGEGALGGRRVAFVVSEFAFLAGSIGVATADRIVAAVARATREGLPLLAAPCSGGTRMQEGTAAFVQMARITAAVMVHRRARLPYLVYLRHPTTGGVLASWGSLGHLTAAEPGALIGFLGPRVYEALHGEPFPEGVQRAENLADRGIVDAVIRPEDLRPVVRRVLDVLCAPGKAARPGPETAASPGPPAGAWEAVERTRREGRAGVRELLAAAGDLTVLSGTGEGEDDPGLRLALASFGTARCVVVGQDRCSRREGHPIGPGGLRVARRGMRLAAELGLPLVTVVDTPGAVLSAEAENRGLAGEIARCLAELTVLDTATVCLLLGEGAGGAALALLPADRVLAAENAWLAPLPPEGASVIVHRTPERAPELAEAQGIRAADLLARGIVDRILAEETTALTAGIETAVREASALTGDRLAVRAARFAFP